MEGELHTSPLTRCSAPHTVQPPTAQPLTPTLAAILESYTTAVISLYALLILALAMLLHSSLGVMHVIVDERDSFPSLSSPVFGCSVYMMLGNGRTIITL